MSGAMSDGYLQLDLSKVSSDMTVIDVTTSGDVSSIVLSKQGNSRRARQRNEEYRSYEYGSFVNSNDLYSSANAGYGRQRSDGSLVKIYGYADRGLYKP
ncbi:MAG: hypothetical protein Q8O99_04610 [bacterium]|nr:hypothetical protein [bacterium]